MMYMSERGSERYIAMSGCMFLDKFPTTMCLAKSKQTNENWT